MYKVSHTVTLSYLAIAKLLNTYANVSTFRLPSSATFRVSRFHNSLLQHQQFGIYTKPYICDGHVTHIFLHNAMLMQYKLCVCVSVCHKCNTLIRTEFVKRRFTQSARSGDKLLTVSDRTPV